MKIKQFNLSVLSTHKVFFLLDKLPKDSTEVDVWIQTPTGYESVDFVDVFKMKDGSLLAAWTHPLQKLGLQNLVAFADGKTQVLNLYPVERIWDIYNKPVDSNSGTFNFVASKVIEGADWRCDRGHYGARSFAGEIEQPVIKSLDEVVAYESFLSVAGIGHLIYLESSNPDNWELANYKLNNSIIPTTGRTLQEALRLIYEWSVLAGEPFNSKDEAAVAAAKYLDALQFTNLEIEQIANLPEMQIAQFIKGSDSARTRPDNLVGLPEGVAKAVFSKMASSSLSFIVSENPEIWDIDEVLEEEWNQFDAGIARFREYYGIPEYVSLEETSRVLDFAEIQAPKQLSYVHNQLRHFANKRAVLGRFRERKA